MPLKIIHPHHTEIMGRGLVLLSSPRVDSTRRDLYTGQIVEEAALLSKGWAIIAKESKQLQEEDMAGLAGSDFDKSVHAFVEDYGVRCIIAISGTLEPGITIKGRQYDSESKEILEIIRSGLEPHVTINASMENSGIGLSSSTVNNQGTDNSSNQSVHMIQLELGPEERGFWKDQIISGIADIVGSINVRLGFSESDERGSSVLD